MKKLLAIVFAFLFIGIATNAQVPDCDTDVGIFDSYINEYPFAVQVVTPVAVTNSPGSLFIDKTLIDVGLAPITSTAVIIYQPQVPVYRYNYTAPTLGARFWNTDVGWYRPY